MIVKRMKRMLKKAKKIKYLVFLSFLMPVAAFADVAPAQADESFLNKIFGLLIYALKAILAVLILAVDLSWIILPYFAYKMVDKYYKRKEDTSQEDLSKEKYIAGAAAIVAGIITGFLLIGGIGMLAFNKTSFFDGIGAMLGHVFSTAMNMISQNG